MVLSPFFGGILAERRHNFPREVGERRIAGTHHQHEIAGASLFGNTRGEPRTRRRELGLDSVRPNLTNDVGGGEVAAGSTSGVKHFEHPEAILAA